VGDLDMTSKAESKMCRRCGRPVIAVAADYDTFEQMHYICFHFEFEHDADPDLECQSGGCPAAGVGMSLLLRTQGVDLVQAGNTVVPALLSLLQLGCRVEREGAYSCHQ
jgi:hypothetical protein